MKLWMWIALFIIVIVVFIFIELAKERNHYKFLYNNYRKYWIDELVNESKLFNENIELRIEHWSDLGAKDKEIHKNNEIMNYMSAVLIDRLTPRQYSEIMNVIKDIQNSQGLHRL